MARQTRHEINEKRKRRRDEIAQNYRIKREHMRPQHFGGPVDPNPLKAVRNVVRQVVRFGGNPMHTRRKRR